MGKASLANIDDGKINTWSGSQCPDGLVVGTTDKLLFVDQYSGGLVMSGYGGPQICTVMLNYNDELIQIL